ncbi:MAG TPA: hypothetical protein VL172_10820, partial [Kofleriaceae bacterium]|nr:hypothetical protein [Kofleriaceae bacterium]
MRGLSVTLCLLLACAGEPGPPTLVVPADAGVAAPAGPVDPLASVPQDTPYLLAMLEPLPAAAQARLGPELRPVLQRMAVLAGDLAGIEGDDRVDRMCDALIAELAGGDLLRQHGVIYDLRGVSVVRIESRDAAGLEAALARAAARVPGVGRRDGGARWLAASGERRLYVAADGAELLVAEGDAALLDPMMPVLRREAPLPAPPVSADGLRKLAVEHELLPSVIGYLDPARVGERLKDPQLLASLGAKVDDSSAQCRDAVGGALADLPRVVFGARAPAPGQVELVAEFDLSPGLRAALAAQAPVPGIPPGFAGQPLIGLAIAGSDVAGAAGPWEMALRRILFACDPKASLALLASPLDQIRGGALVIYDGKLEGFFPTHLQGYAVLLTRDAQAAVDKLHYLGVRPPRLRDGAPFVKLGLGKLRGFVDAAYLARRGDSVVLAVGDQGRAQAEAALAPAGPAPFLALSVDLARFNAFGTDHPSSPLDQQAERVKQVDDGLLADAGLYDLRDRLIGRVDVSIRSGPRGLVAAVRLDLLPPPAAP